MESKTPKKFQNSWYLMTISLGELKDYLTGIFEGSLILDTEPLYQRKSNWSEDQKIEYMKSILIGQDRGRDFYWNCPAWLNFNNRPREDRILQLVDGKQRLNTLLMFLEDELPVFGGAFLKNFTYQGILLSDVCKFNFVINTLESEEEVIEWYIDLNQKDSLFTEHDLQTAYNRLSQLKVN